MILDKWYNGIGRSKYDSDRWDNLVNVDVHSELGAVQCQTKLETASTTPNEPCIQATASNGDVFFASTTSGNIWKLSSGTYSLVHTNSNGANKGIHFFNGNLYYATSGYLGKISGSAASSEDTWSSQNDSFGTFTNGDDYKPMFNLNLSLFIGDGKYLASVDYAGTFSANALDLNSDQRITTIAGVGTSLLISSTNNYASKVYAWDTYSSSWTSEDDVPETSINCFIPTDNIVFAQAGDNIYYWTGSRMQKFKQIRDITPVVNHYATTSYNGRALFSNGKKIFSLHRADKDMPFVIVQEYTSTIDIQSIGVSGSLLVSTASEVQKTGSTNAIGEITTPEVKGHKVIVHYDTLDGTIGISTKVDGGSWTTQTPIVDTVKKQVSFNGGLGQVNFLQAKITLTPNTQIKVKSIEI